MAWRGRRAWGNCDKGRRLANGRWELWPPENPEYYDPARWAEIRDATKAFGEGYEAAKAEPWLFTHKVGGQHPHRLQRFRARRRAARQHDGDKHRLAVARRRQRDQKELAVEARALVKDCAEAEDRTTCLLAGMSPGLRCAYDHLSPVYQGAILANR